MRLLLTAHAADFGIAFDPALLDAIEAQAAVIRITRGNFRLMERLFAQVRRIMTLNRVEEVDADIVQAARNRLVIGSELTGYRHRMPLCSCQAGS